MKPFYPIPSSSPLEGERREDKDLSYCLREERHQRHEMRIGLLGGTFNPIHLGHIKIAQAVLTALKLDAVWFIPTGKSPHKKETKSPTRRDRFEMVRIATEGHPHFKPCDIEIRRRGVSYTINTLSTLKRLYPNHTFFFIIGTDAFSSLHQWKNPEKLLTRCSFVIVARNGYPYHLPDMRQLDGIDQHALAQLDRNERTRYTFSPVNGLPLYFIRTPLHPASACEIRNKILSGENVKNLLPRPVLSYIMNSGLYKEGKTIPRKKKETPVAVWTAKEKALCIAKTAFMKKAEDIVLLQISDLSSVGDYYVICSADSEPQVRAIVDAVEEELLTKNCRPLGIEGMRALAWVLVDFDDVILHIFRKESRSFYNLDRLWGDAPRIDFSKTALTDLKRAPVKRKRKIN